MKFRKKPIVIEAEQWFEGTIVDGVHMRKHEVPHIHTLEGEMHVSSGDWIITGIAGEKYPCKPDIFEQTYDLVS